MEEEIDIAKSNAYLGTIYVNNSLIFKTYEFRPFERVVFNCF